MPTPAPTTSPVLGPMCSLQATGAVDPQRRSEPRAAKQTIPTRRFIVFPLAGQAPELCLIADGVGPLNNGQDVHGRFTQMAGEVKANRAHKVFDSGSGPRKSDPFEQFRRILREIRRDKVRSRAA